jgi:hypothetical protein
MLTIKKTDDFQGSGSLVNVLKFAIMKTEHNRDSKHKLTLFVHQFSLRQKNKTFKRNTSEFEKNLAQMIDNYLKTLPTLINEFDQQCKILGWHSLTHKTDSLLLDFFDEIDAQIQEEGVIGILDRVYFAHRVIEELHDRMICKLGYPVLSWDMTMANLLVHQMLGTHYSTHLDQTAMELCEKLLVELPEQSEQVQKKATQIWPCFCEQFDVDMNW